VDENNHDLCSSHEVSVCSGIYKVYDVSFLTLFHFHTPHVLTKTRGNIFLCFRVENQNPYKIVHVFFLVFPKLHRNEPLFMETKAKQKILMMSNKMMVTAYEALHFNTRHNDIKLFCAHTHHV
jgi:hypothetical protein